MKLLALKLRAWLQIFRHFRNPLLVSAMRLGWLKPSLFAYRITAAGKRYVMLARPSATCHSDISIMREVLVEGEYGQVLPLLPAGPVRVLDIGANLGSFTVWLQHHHGLREAYCFEPEPGSFNLCRFNLANNGCETATPIPKAIGGRNRTIEMWTDTARPGSVNIYGQPSSAAKEKKSVEVIALADWLRATPGNFDLLKMDCEGAEWEIFRETPPDLLRRFNVIIAEVHADPVQPNTPVAEFRQRLEAAGFTTVRDDNCWHGLYIGVQKPPRG